MSLETQNRKDDNNENIKEDLENSESKLDFEELPEDPRSSFFHPEKEDKKMKGADPPDTSRVFPKLSQDIVRKRAKKDDKKDFLTRLVKPSQNRLTNAMKSLVAKKIVEREEYEIVFSLSRTVKMFIYHTLFYFIGIFATLLILIIEGYQFTKNLGFIGMHLRFIIMQYSTQVMFIGFIVLVAVLPMKSISQFESYFFIMLMVLRSFIVAVRYGFISNSRYKLYKSPVKLFWITSDFLLLGWLKMSPKIIHEQIDAAKYRLQIQKREWKFTFITPLATDIHQRLMINAKDSKDAFEKIDKEFASKMITADIFPKSGAKTTSLVAHAFAKMPEENKDYALRDTDEENVEITQSYEAEAILREMCLLESHAHSTPIYSLIIIIARIAIQIISQFYHNGKSFSVYWYEYLLTSWLIVDIVIIYGSNLLFIIAGIIDFKRKLFFMKILQSMISIQKSKDFQYSTYFPTLNILNKENLKSWLKLRSASLDLGKKFTYRIFLYCSIYLSVYLTYLIFLLMIVFRIIKADLAIAAYLAGTFDIIVILTILFQMLRMGAQVNDYYDIHKGELITIKKLLFDARDNPEIYVNLGSSADHSDQLLGKMIRTIPRSSTSTSKYIDDCIMFIEIAIQELEYEKATKPLKLMGLTCSNELLTSVYTGIASISFALIQYIYSRY
ncbi:unnamed protein product [Moneuplotes crassus]|uniref:Uncharacterized protein n=2 Tax=Euplotes crassus TaxID=5936 RepID=A0AAD1Y9K9_EUPCR|nr:unnamed protein product [Moneuplotes crassus]